MGEASSISHLFLYGTLLPELRVPEAPAVADRVRRVGEATLPGRLLDLGRYPGLVRPACEGDVVRGRVYALLDASALDELDRYEDAYPDAPDRGLFVREAATATLDAGDSRTCWVYCYNGPVDERPVVPSGSWVTHRGG